MSAGGYVLSSADFGPLQPSENPDDESPCPCDRWCLDSDGSPGDCKVDDYEDGAEDEDNGLHDNGVAHGPCSIKGKFGARGGEESPLKEVPFPTWVERFVSQVLRSRTRFAHFLKNSIDGCRNGRSPSCSTALFPIPVPDVGIWGTSRQLSKEKRVRRAEVKILHMVVVALNYQYFRKPFAILQLLRRRPSPEHQDVFSRLLTFIRACGHSGMVSVAGCGRKSFQLDARFDELWSFLRSQGLDNLGVYHCGFGGLEVAKDDSRAEELRPYRDLDASRLKISGCGEWRCEEFLPDLLYLPYVEPRINVYDVPLREGTYPDNPKNDYNQMLALCRLWDSKGLLRLIPCSLAPPQLACCVRVFNNYKNSLVDRQIGDRRGSNQLEGKIPGPSKGLPSATSLLQLYVAKHRERLCGSITDRRDFYHQFHTTWEKSSLNCIYPWPRLSELHDLGAASVFVEQYMTKKRKKLSREEEGDFLAGPKKSLLFEKDPVVAPCFAALFQGDHLGVEVATASHSQLLEEAGFLQSGSRLLSDDFLVHDKLVDGLVIDDYFVISREPALSQSSQRRSESGSASQLLRAKNIYQREGLMGSDDKDIIGEDEFKVVGGEVNSSAECVSRGNVPVAVPSSKRWGLAMLSAALAELPYTSDALHASVVGAWISTLLYRRPMMTIMNELFKVIPHHELDTEKPRMWRLPRGAAEELCLLAVLAPMMASNLTIPFSEILFASDASLSKGAYVSSSIPRDLSQLLWRSADKKGENVPLMRSSEALLSLFDPDFEPLPFGEAGYMSYGGDLEEEEGGEEPVPRPLGMRFEFLEICGGAGLVTQYLCQLGVVCGPVFDLSNSQQFDWSSLRVVRWMIFMCEDGRLLSFLVAPTCTTFSPAAFPALRSYRNPLGHDLTNPRVIHGNLLSFHSLALMFVARRLEVFGLLEQPLRSKMRWLDRWRRLLKLGATEVHLASCAYGSIHEKKFCFLGVNMMADGLRKKCTRDHVHVPIQGKFTKPSATYTKGLALALARVFRDHLVARTRALEVHEISAEGLEDVISNDLSACKKWHTEEVWSWQGNSHINLLQASAVCRVFQRVGRCGGDSRFVFLCDSHVARASITRGRTSSGGMRPILSRISALSVAYGLYRVGRYSPTRLNPADAPTRDYVCQTPCSSSILSDLSYEEIAWVASLPRMRRWAANWARLVLLSWPSIVTFHSHGGCLRRYSRYPLGGPEIAREFDSSLGYPGEGPAPRSMWLLLFAFGAMLFGHPSALSTQSLLYWYASLSTLACSVALLLYDLVAFFIALSSWLFIASSSLCLISSSSLSATKPHQLYLILVVSLFAVGSSTGFRGSHGDEHRKSLRTGIDLPDGRRVTELTSSNRQVFLNQFYSWLSQLDRSPGVVFEGPPDIDLINRWICEYGRKLFRDGKPYYHFSETINAIAGKRPTLRRSLMQAWDLAFMWNSYEPVEHHCAVPHQALLAILTTCLMWGWVREASIFALLFGALLRSGEVLAATRRDLIFPQDVAGTQDHILIRILEPKTRFRAARHQASRVEQPDLMRVISLGLFNIPRCDPLWPLSGSALRGRLTKVLQRLELPTKSGSIPKALTLASFRAGGATWLIAKSESVELTRRRGRWISVKVLETYLQEVSASTYMNEVQQRAKERTLAAMSIFCYVLVTAERFARSRLPTATWFFLFLRAFGQRQHGQEGKYG